MQLYPKSWQSLIFAVLRIGVALYAIIFILLFFAQERLIFPGSKLPTSYHFKFDIPFEEKSLIVDGKRMNSLLFAPANSSGLILYFHGNAGCLDSWGEAAQEIAERTSMRVWILDYPGYGKSEGAISSEDQLHAVALAFFEAAESLVPKEQIVLYGRSIGSGLAVKLASEKKVAALILESPYFSFDHLAREKVPWAPIFLLKYKFHSDKWLPRVTSPTLIFHGDQDEVIPYDQGKKLSALLEGSTFIPIHNGHHNDLDSFPEFWDSLRRFLRESQSSL